VRNENAKPALRASFGAQKAASEFDPWFSRIAHEAHTDFRCTGPDMHNALKTTLNGRRMQVLCERNLAFARPKLLPKSDLAKNLPSIVYALLCSPWALKRTRRSTELRNYTHMHQKGSRTLLPTLSKHAHEHNLLHRRQKAKERRCGQVK